MMNLRNVIVFEVYPHFEFDGSIAFTKENLPI